MSDTNNVNVFEQIDSICRSFRKQWKESERPDIGDFVDRVESTARPNLLRNLLNLELELRRRSGEQPSAKEYADRFPDYVSVVRQAFLMSTMASMGSSVAEDMTISFDASAVSQLGQYHLIRELGRGGFGIVYEAQHLTGQNRVALKTLRQQTSSGERLHQFRREFRSLSNVSHPNLVGMQSLEVDGEQWFFTMDLVDGEDFISYVCPSGKLDIERLRAALPQLVSGLMVLHGQHIVHRDVKPSNVMVTHDGAVRVLDFGLVTEFEQSSLGPTASFNQHFAGTPAYAAPEQVNGTRTSASDWYAVGVMLYEALAGELPFQGSPIEILTQKQTRDAPSLIGQDDVPEDLAKLTMQMLARVPTDRPSALEIARLISANLPISRTSKSGEQILVGRDQHLEEMQQAFQAFVTDGGAATLFVEGRSGEGKTTLVEHFLRELRQNSDAVVLSGRCYDRESVPLKALDCLIDPLCNWLRSQKDKAADYLPEDIHMLAHLFPVMRRVDVVATASTKKVGRIDMKQVRQRAFVALREMLHRISRVRLVILFVDDLQWGDADSASAILGLIKPPDPPAVLFLGTYRSDEADEAAFLKSWQSGSGSEELADHLVTLGPLSLEECVELVIARLGDDSDSLRRRAAMIFEATGGNPYFLDQLIEGLDTETDTFHAIPLQEIVDRKLSQLPDSARRLLDLISLSGHSVSISEISQAAGEGANAVSTLTHMRTERLVRLIDSGDEQLVDTYHDKIRETTIDRLPPEHKSALHRTLGETIERMEATGGESDLPTRIES